MNFEIYENNLEVWKPYIDYESVCVGSGNMFYFLGGRKIAPIATYNVA